MRVDRRCALCGRFKLPDGLLLCQTCQSLGTYTQDVDVQMHGAPGFRIEADGTVRCFPGGHAKTTTRAHLRAGQPGQVKPFVKVTRITYEHNDDRQSHEVVTKVFDRRVRPHRYRQTWTNGVTGENTWSKSGNLGDKSLHGPESHRETTPDPTAPVPERPMSRMYPYGAQLIANALLEELASGTDENPSTPDPNPEAAADTDPTPAPAD